MIVVSGTFELGHASIETARAAMAEMAEETRGETGCISYAFFQSIESPTTFRVFEEWESDDALKAHFDAPHMKEFRAKLGTLEILSRDVKRYAVSESSSL